MWRNEATGLLNFAIYGALPVRCLLLHTAEHGYESDVKLYEISYAPLTLQVELSRTSLHLLEALYDVKRLYGTG